MSLYWGIGILKRYKKKGGGEQAGLESNKG